MINFGIQKRDRAKNVYPLSVICYFLTILCSLFIISCQTTQSPESYFHDGRIPLASGANVYIAANVKEARSIIALLPIPELKSAQIKQMLDRTNFAMAALFPRESGRRFQMAAWGNYPSTGADAAFSLGDRWKKHSAAGRSYWHSAADRLSVFVTSRQAFALGTLNDTPLEPFPADMSAGARIPEGFNDFRKGAALSFWVEIPGPSIQRMLNSAGIPIRAPVEKLFVNINKAGSEPARQQYEAVIRLSFETAAQARGMASILSLASGFSSNDPSLRILMFFLATPPVQNGSILEIKSALMGENDIKLATEAFIR